MCRFGMHRLPREQWLPMQSGAKSTVNGLLDIKTLKLLQQFLFKFFASHLLHLNCLSTLKKTFSFSPARTAWSITHAVWTMLLFAMQICELVPAAELRWVEAVWKRRVDECTTNPAALKRRGLEDGFLCGIGTFFQWQHLVLGRVCILYRQSTVVSKLRWIGG